MRDKKIGRIIILASFIIVICLYRVLWIWGEKYEDQTNYDNREKATRPDFSLEGYGTYTSDFTDYFNDNLPFRNSLITLNSELDYYCFKKTSIKNVVIGKNNWLFYCNENDGDPIASYRGENLYTENELFEIAQNCIKQRDILKSMGKEFVIFIAPNKERVYPEFMPEKYGEPASNYRVLQIVNYLKDNTDLRIVYPYEELMDAKNKINENIWYKTDTHWNYVGGYIGASALLDELGIFMPKIESKDICITSRGESFGDLASMLSMRKQFESVDTEYEVTGYDLHNRQDIEWNFNEMVRYRATGADPRSIYVIRDSFSTHMAPYIGSQFANSYLRNKSTYTYDDLMECNPDIVVYEIVERNAWLLKTFSIKSE